MYSKLFNKVSDVIAELQQIQKDTELLYMETAGSELMAMSGDADSKPSKQQNSVCPRK